MRTQEAAIKTRAVTFRPRRSTGPRPEHSEGAGGGGPQWPGEPPPQTPRLHWPSACPWGPVPPEGKEQAKEASTRPTVRPHPGSAALPVVLGTGSPSRKGLGFLASSPGSASQAAASQAIKKCQQHLLAPEGRPARPGAGAGLPAEQRLLRGCKAAAAQSPRPDLSCESPDQPAPHLRELGDGTLKTPSEKEGSQGDKCQTLSRAARLLPHKKDAVPLQLPGCHSRQLGAGDPTWSLWMGSGVAA